MKSSVYWDITPCSPLKVNRLCVPPAFTLDSCSAYSSTLKMESICSSETSVDLPPTTRRHLSSTLKTESICSSETLVDIQPTTRRHISSTLKMESICSSETSVDIQRTTRRHIPEDGTLHNHRCENLKSYISEFLLRS
jgi:hypothetical protein